MVAEAEAALKLRRCVLTFSALAYFYGIRNVMRSPWLWAALIDHRIPREDRGVSEAHARTLGLEQLDA